MQLILCHESGNIFNDLQQIVSVLNKRIDCSLIKISDIDLRNTSDFVYLYIPPQFIIANILSNSKEVIQHQMELWCENSRILLDSYKRSRLDSKVLNILDLIGYIKNILNSININDVDIVSLSNNMIFDIKDINLYLAKILITNVKDVNSLYLELDGVSSYV